MRSKSQGKAVTINARIRRVDGKPLNRRQMLAVLEYFYRYEDLPPGIEVLYIDWRRPKKAKKFSTGAKADEDFENLKNVMLSLRRDGKLSVEPRLGSVSHG